MSTPFPGFLKITVPVALSYFGIMLLGMLDLIMVGQLGPVAQGAVGIGTSVFAWFMIFGIGLLSAMDYLVSHAFGAGRPRDAAHTLVQSLWLGTAMAIPLTALLYAVTAHLEIFGLSTEVTPLARSYLLILNASLWPVFLFSAARNYLQAIHRVWEGLVVLLVANGLNVFLNWKLIPALGSDGSGWATLICRYGMMLAMVALAWSAIARRHRPKSQAPDFAEWRRLLHLGLPAALQSTAEVGVFALSTILAGRLDAASLAAHQIVLNLASMTFMVPLGIGTAAAVIVGYFLGREAPATAHHQGWRALRITLLFMACTAILFATAGKPLLSIYSSDSAVLALAWPALLVAAMFQLFDGAQTVLTGALRGWGDTRSAFVANLIGHWAIGFPLGLFLGFTRKMGILGIWSGLAIGLTCVAIGLLWIWRGKSPISPPKTEGPTPA